MGGAFSVDNIHISQNVQDHIALFTAGAGGDWRTAAIKMDAMGVDDGSESLIKGGNDPVFVSLNKVIASQTASLQKAAGICSKDCLSMLMAPPTIIRDSTNQVCYDACMAHVLASAAETKQAIADQSAHQYELGTGAKISGESKLSGGYESAHGYQLGTGARFNGSSFSGGYASAHNYGLGTGIRFK